ncbi:MAG TPA: NmrA family NAD(P)-binding protein [Jiangellaceae bacterium]|nr:NmrA family NAD(P)-binding protein [Jiangellaceae bacterium]
MYAIAGATGRVGSVAAEQLLAAGAPVRVLVRNPAAAQRWTERGAEVAVTDLEDGAGLTAALIDCDGLFILLPFNLTAANFHAHTRALVATIAEAVTDSGVPHVAMLSSAGADLPEGTGPIVGLYQLEQALRTTGAVISAVRSGHFQEKVSDLLDSARHSGIYPVFAETADKPIPMVATPDLGEVVAQTLLTPPRANQVIDVEGPAYTERQVAAVLGSALGRQLEVVTLPRPAWAGALMDAGFSAHIAEVLTELYDADQRGVLVPRGDRTVRATTELEATIAGLIGATAQRGQL